MIEMTFEDFTQNSLLIMKSALEYCQEFNHGVVGCDHLLLGILSVPSRCCEVIQSLGLSSEAVKANLLMEPQKDKFIGEFSMSPNLKRILIKAEEIKAQYGHPAVYPTHLMLSILESEPNIGYEIIVDRLNLDLAVLKHGVEQIIGEW